MHQIFIFFHANFKRHIGIPFMFLINHLKSHCHSVCQFLFSIIFCQLFFFFFFFIQFLCAAQLVSEDRRTANVPSDIASLWARCLLSVYLVHMLQYLLGVWMNSLCHFLLQSIYCAPDGKLKNIPDNKFILFKGPMFKKCILKSIKKSVLWLGGLVNWNIESLL